MKKTIYVFLGLLFTGIGAIGALLPILPTVPFLLLAVYFFARSSDKLLNWLKSTKLYKNNLESFVDRRVMSKKAKVKLIITFTIVIMIAFYMMRNTMVGRIAITIVWGVHIFYFVFGIKTAR